VVRNSGKRKEFEEFEEFKKRSQEPGVRRTLPRRLLDSGS
jgi:hypothetical protein